MVFDPTLDDSGALLSEAAEHLIAIGYAERIDLTTGQVVWTERGRIIAGCVAMFMREFGRADDARLQLAAQVICLRYGPKLREEK